MFHQSAFSCKQCLLVAITNLVPRSREAVKMFSGAKAEFSRMGDSGDSFPWSSLTALGLPHNAIGPSGAVALARDAFPKLKVLRELLLYSNNIGTLRHGHTDSSSINSFCLCTSQEKAWLSWQVLSGVWMSDLKKEMSAVPTSLQILDLPLKLTEGLEGVAAICGALPEPGLWRWRWDCTP